MTSKFRAAALAFVAVLAMGAVTASAAQATGVFEAEEYPASLSSEQLAAYEFTSELGTIVCKTSAFQGELTNPSGQLTLSTAFGGCTLGGTAVTIESEGCKLVAHSAEEEEAGGFFEATADIACPVGKGIKIHLPLGCLLTVNAQINLSDININVGLSFPPNITLADKIVNLQAKLEDTPGKKCFLGTKNVSVSVGGKSKVRAKNNAGEVIGLVLS